MNNKFSGSWWVPALRGVLAILFGVLILLQPGITLLALVLLFAAYAVLTGVVSIAGAFQSRQTNEDWWMLLLIGLVGVGAGIIAVAQPALTALVLVLIIGVNALVTGMLDIVTAIRLRKEIQGEWFLILSGLVSVAFGILVFFFPVIGAMTVIWMISLYAIIDGVLLLALSFRIRAFRKQLFV